MWEFGALGVLAAFGRKSGQELDSVHQCCQSVGVFDVFVSCAESLDVCVFACAAHS